MDRKVWRADPVTYGVLTVPWLLISILLMVAAFKNPQMWSAFGLSLAAAFLSAVWIAAFKVEVTEEELKYSSLLGRDRVVKIQQIRSVKVANSGSEFRDRFLPVVRLHICVEPVSGIKDFHINLKVLRRGAGAQIMDATGVRS